MSVLVERRKAPRIQFDKGIDVHILSIDGTWRRPCLLLDVSETGARLKIDGTVENLNLKEFFLLLSSTGLAFRRCEFAWLKGEEIGVRFLRGKDLKR
jgi:hypothetical protein